MSPVPSTSIIALVSSEPEIGTKQETKAIGCDEEAVDHQHIARLARAFTQDIAMVLITRCPTCARFHTRDHNGSVLSGVTVLVLTNMMHKLH